MDGYGCLEWRDKSESPFSFEHLTTQRTMYANNAVQFRHLFRVVERRTTRRPTEPRNFFSFYRATNLLVAVQRWWVTLQNALPPSVLLLPLHDERSSPFCPSRIDLFAVHFVRSLSLSLSLTQ